MGTIKNTIFVLTILMISGCAIGPDFIKPQIEIPPQYKAVPDSVKSIRWLI